MISWSENYFNRLRESEEVYYLEDLKKLIAGEAAAAIQYKFASKCLMGKDQSYLGQHFSEHADEEWSHYNQLIDALLQRDGNPDLTIEGILDNANPDTKELAKCDSDYLRDFFIRAEDSAIEAYKKFYSQIEKADPDLADIINGIISDERDHKLDFTRMSQE